MTMIAQHMPSAMSRRSGFILQADQLPLQHWIASQHAPKTNRRPAAKSLSSLKDMPCTHEEWKKILSQVKSHYSNKRYRHCSSRCIELLKSAQARDNAQPAYLIYLQFYAATSLETQARSLHPGSPYRLRLLEEAREYYNLASQKTKAAHQEAAKLTLRPVSPTSSLPSPSESCLSHASLSTRMTSPTPSATSSTDSPVRRKKKVAFADELEYRSAVRPDSPTLGFADPSSTSSSICGDVGLELLPPPSVQTKPDVCPAIFPSPSLGGDEFHQNLTEERYTSSQESLQRYHTVLSSIQNQITSHVAAIDRDITAALASQPSVPITEEMRSLELRSRIERLRANGWQRKRFDAKRYENFREEVMADMLT